MIVMIEVVVVVVESFVAFACAAPLLWRVLMAATATTGATLERIWVAVGTGSHRFTLIFGSYTCTLHSSVAHNVFNGIAHDNKHTLFNGTGSLCSLPLQHLKQRRQQAVANGVNQ
jgi:hypothetical protein